MNFDNPFTSQNQFGGVVFQRNSKATVPVARPYGMGCQDDGLHVPHQNVPMYTSGSHVNRRPTNPNEWTSYGWKDMSDRFLGYTGRKSSWNDEQYFDPSRPKEMSLGFSREDIEYAKLREKKEHEILANVTDKQKKMVDDVLSGKIFKLSKLIEET
jgi:hypothetical protein